ncbi:MAG: hypothetical protein II637_01315 [Bacteroidales bacterium]|nr:hypothetical protein [Bacteroidales bacterium]
MPLTVGQLEEVLSTVVDKDTPVCVNDETCDDSEITAVAIHANKVSLYINGKVVEA